MIFTLQQLHFGLSTITIDSGEKKKLLDYLKTCNIKFDFVSDIVVTNKIFKIAEEVTGVTRIVFEGYNRREPIAIYRHMVAYLIKKYTQKSLKTIGAEDLNGRDHTTIINCQKKVQEMIDTRNDYFHQLVLIETILIENLNKINYKNKSKTTVNENY